jgi:hypothetical protein
LEINFSTAFFPKSIHWCFMQEFTECNSGIIAYWRAGSPMPSTIGSWKAKQSYFVCWIAAELRDGSASLCEKPANQAASVDAPTGVSLRRLRPGRRATEQRRCRFVCARCRVLKICTIWLAAQNPIHFEYER